MFFNIWININKVCLGHRSRHLQMCLEDNWGRDGEAVWTASALCLSPPCTLSRTCATAYIFVFATKETQFYLIFWFEKSEGRTLCSFIHIYTLGQPWRSTVNGRAYQTSMIPVRGGTALHSRVGIRWGSREASQCSLYCLFGIQAEAHKTEL